MKKKGQDVFVFFCDGKLIFWIFWFVHLPELEKRLGDIEVANFFHPHFGLRPSFCSQSVPFFLHM